MSDPTTPREMLERLASLPPWTGVMEPGDVQIIIREFCRLAGLDRSLHDAQKNALDAVWFLREMGEVEL